MSVYRIVSEIFNIQWPWNLRYRIFKIIQPSTIRKLGYGFLSVFHGSILCHFPDKARYWSKSRFFITVHSTRLSGGSSSEYCHAVWCGKTRMVPLPDGDKILRICLTVWHNTGDFDSVWLLTNVWIIITMIIKKYFISAGRDLNFSVVYIPTGHRFLICCISESTIPRIRRRSPLTSGY